MGDVVDFEGKKSRKSMQRVVDRTKEKTGFKKDIDLSTEEFPIRFIMFGMRHSHLSEKDRVRIVMNEKLGESAEEQCVAGSVTLTREQWEEMKRRTDKHFRAMEESRGKSTKKT